MGKGVIEKIIHNHLLEGELKPGEEIAIKIDQTLTQDATGTMVCLEFETLGLQEVRTEKSANYVDHNTLQVGFENADDHLFLKSCSKKYGMYYSKPGNGICHQLHLHRFAVPGKILLGADSHTPTSGALGMLAIGTGGLNVTMAMAGEPYYLNMPEIVNIILKGELKPTVNAKDLILYILKEMGVKGGVGKAIEYTGPGIKSLSIPQRATITNMGAELGVTTSIFPGDEISRDFIKAQQREQDWLELLPDKDAEYSEVIEINLGDIESMVAKPHSPDNVVKISDLEKTRVDQVYIGSCTNSSYTDLARAAEILTDKKIHPDLSLLVSPGSKQVFTMLARDNYIEKFINAGARILECSCGPCVGVGQAPPSGGITVRTSNRNFKGRSGTIDAGIYLTSPETAAMTAITGYITDPSEYQAPDNLRKIKEPEEYLIDDSLIISADISNDIELRRGPNIKSLPYRKTLENNIEGRVILKTGDNISTDDIMPAGAKILPLRSNIPAISEHVFKNLDKNFVNKAKKEESGIIVGGENYGQGSSREHAAIAPMYLGIKAVIAKSFSRIHHDNLLNFGILPLCFSDKESYINISDGDILIFKDVQKNIKTGFINIKNTTKDYIFKTYLKLSPRAQDILLAGGLLNYVKNKNNGGI